MGHILNCGKTATNTCIIRIQLSLVKPGSSARYNITLKVKLFKKV